MIHPNLLLLLLSHMDGPSSENHTARSSNPWRSEIDSRSLVDHPPSLVDFLIIKKLEYPECVP